MTRFKKSIAFTASMALILSSVPTAELVSAESLPTWYWGEVSSLSLPDGYEEWSAEWDLVRYYSNSGFDAIYYDDFRYNCVSLTLTADTDWNSAYETYCAELGFDKVIEDEAVVTLYDTSEEGDDPRSPASVSDKAELVEAMSEKMYKDGAIEAASYTAFSAHYKKGDIDKLITGSCDLDENALAEVVTEYSEDFSVTVSNGGFRVALNDVETVDELLAIVTSIKSTDGIIDAGILMSFPEGGGGIAGVEAVNLLTAIQEEESCDINQSGTPDLDDASLLLTHYANTAAGIATAAEADTSSYDVNGDGTVDLDDALKIVTVYAEMAAGLR